MTLKTKTMGLALSGGGFRATLFGLGSVWRLNEAGLLGKLDRITSVSGGSILSGILAHGWSELQFVDGRATNFEDIIVRKVVKFCGHSIDIKAGLLGLLTPFKSAGEFLAGCYNNDLFHGFMLKDIPPAVTDQVPHFIFYATNMQTGRSFRFRQDIVADYVLGVSHSVDICLADVVAASSAFPPIFSPVVLETDPDHWDNALKDVPSLANLRKRIVLADGGVYDNLGLESLVDNVDIVLVSDAGAPFIIDENPWEDNFLQLGRVRDILIDQTRALRKRWLICDFMAGRKTGAYWGIGTKIGDFQAIGALTSDNKVTATLENIPTRLNRFAEREQGYLINWGYALADAALRTRAGIQLEPDPSWPIPCWRLDAVSEPSPQGLQRPTPP